MMKPSVVSHTVILALGKLKQGDFCKFKASLNCIVRLCLTKRKYDEIL